MDHPKENIRSLVDWVQFTLQISGYVTVDVPDPDDDSEQPVVRKKKMPDLTPVYELLGIDGDQFVDVPYGMHFYRRQKACGHIRILYEGYTANTDMTIHVHISGHGCREYETYYTKDGWEPLFWRVVQAGGKFTRLDLAVDEIRYDGERPIFTLRQMIWKLKRDECRSKFKKAFRHETIHIGGGKSEGQTIYFGSAQSDIKVRAYEKNFERLANDKELEENLTTWNRLEVSLADQRAEEAVRKLLGISEPEPIPVGQLTLGILAHYLDFVDRQPGDSNKARWPRTAWWETYLNAVDKLRLAKAAPDRTIEQKQSWIDKQTLPTIAQIWYAYGCPGADMFTDMLEKGMERMTEAQWQQAQEYAKMHEMEQRRYQERFEAKTAELYEKGYFIRNHKSVIKDSVITFYREMLEKIKNRLDTLEQVQDDNKS